VRKTDELFHLAGGDESQLDGDLAEQQIFR
jgi:hypothetical protein